MKRSPDATRSQSALDAAVGLIAVLLVAQMWLLTASLEGYLAGHYEVAKPGAGVSALLFVSCFGLYRSIVSIDRLRTTRRG